MSAAALLRERAESYGTDARTLRANGDTADAVMYETIRNELRRVAAQVEASGER